MYSFLAMVVTTMSLYSYEAWKIETRDLVTQMVNDAMMNNKRNPISPRDRQGPAHEN